MGKPYKKLIKIIFLIAMLVVTFLSTIGFFLKHSEVTSLKEKIMELQNQKNELNIQIENLTHQLQNYLKEKNQLTTQLDNNMKFLKMIEKGNHKLKDAFANYGYAESDYDDASRNYRGRYFEVCKSYAKSCDVYYGYAYSYFVEAKNLFEEAKKYATTNNTLTLAELYVNFSFYGSKLANEMHQACEYFSSACEYYSMGYWESGDNRIREMNKHIQEHDELVESYNDYLSKIKALLETL